MKDFRSLIRTNVATVERREEGFAVVVTRPNGTIIVTQESLKLKEAQHSVEYLNKVYKHHAFLSTIKTGRASL